MQMMHTCCIFVIIHIINYVCIRTSKLKRMYHGIWIPCQTVVQLENYENDNRRLVEMQTRDSATLYDLPKGRNLTSILKDLSLFSPLCIFSIFT